MLRESGLLALLDETKELVCTTGADQRIDYVNRAWVEALGYSRDEAAAMRPTDFVAPEHMGMFRDVARRLIAGDRIEEFEAVLVAKDGRRVVCRGRARPVMDDGRCVATHAFYHDVTAERRSGALRARLAATLEATSDLVGIATRDGHIVYLNRAGRYLVGLRDDSDVSQLRADDMHPAHALERIFAEALPAALEHGHWEGESTLVNTHGVEIPVSMVIVSHPSVRPGEPPYFLSTIMRDMRERMRIESELRESRRQFRELLDALPLVVYEVNAEAPYAPIFVSSGILTLGWPHEQWMTQPDTWMRALHPDDRERVEAATHQAREGGGSTNLEYRLMAPDGSIRWVRDTGAFTRDERGVIATWRGVMLDITAQRTAEEALRESAVRFRGILENLRAIGVMLDRDGRVTFANEHLLEVTGWAREDVIGEDWFERFIPEGAAVRQVFLDAIVSGEIPAHFENPIVTRSGERLLVAWDNVVIRSADGDVLGAASVGRDVTGERRVQELREQLIATTSHEVRNPLGAVRSALQLLKRTGAITEGRPLDLLELAIRNADRVGRLTEDLLDAERLDAGEVELNRIVVSAEVLIGNAVETVMHNALSNSLLLKPETIGEDLSVLADVDRISQVLTNLIGNAIKFSPAGSSIIVRAEQTETATVLFSVIDEGRGIPPEQLNRVFERFVQVRAEDASEKKGAGLGLAISKAIVRQHGGEIGVRSVVGGGSTFFFTLPMPA